MDGRNCRSGVTKFYEKTRILRGAQGVGQSRQVSLLLIIEKSKETSRGGNGESFPDLTGRIERFLKTRPRPFFDRMRRVFKETQN